MGNAGMEMLMYQALPISKCQHRGSDPACPAPECIPHTVWGAKGFAQCLSFPLLP